MRQFNKVFGIGISRTGTSSLTLALEILGIPTVHWPTNMYDICKYRGATDITVACRFKELDQIFPDSLFVYTERESKSWLRSVTDHYKKKDPAEILPFGAKQFAHEADIKIFGKIWPKDCDFIQCYEKHQKDVFSHFGPRNNRLLKCNICLGDGWSKLCRFLEIPTPNTAFPRLNRRTS